MCTILSALSKRYNTNNVKAIIQKRTKCKKKIAICKPEKNANLQSNKTYSGTSQNI